MECSSACVLAYLWVYQSECRSEFVSVYLSVSG